MWVARTDAAASSGEIAGRALTEHPLVKFAETGLVLLLAAHMAGGVRLLALEFLEWREWQKSLLAAAAGVSLVAGLAFMLNLV